MNYANIFIKKNYKLYAILLNYNLNTLYINLSKNLLPLSYLFLHKKWLKTYDSININNNNSRLQITWNSKLYLAKSEFNQNTKCIQLTTVNYNINRTIASLTILNYNKPSQLITYNLWNLTSLLRYNSKFIYHFLFLQSCTNLSNLCSFIINSRKIISGSRYFTSLKLSHNLKFL